MRHIDQRKRSCVRVVDPRKLHVSVYENAQTIVSWRSKVFTTRMRSLLPYGINTQNAVCATYIYANTDWRIFRTRKRSHACMSYRRMKSVLLRCTPSLNVRSKLKGQYTDVKSGSGISVGPSLKPHSLSLNKILVTPSLSHNVAVSQAVLRSRHHHFRAAP